MARKTLDLKIRPLLPTDVDRIQQIRAEAFAPIFRSFRAIVGEALAGPAFEKADAEQRLYLDNVLRSSGGSIFVADIAGEIVGFIHLEIDTKDGVGTIGLNAIDPAVSGQGIGTSLYRFAVHFFRDAGLKVVKVSVGGDPSHAAARRAYEKAGFSVGIPSVTLYQKLD
jgi:ribosomal protein S18 acetylase RimI-like enzyme